MRRKIICVILAVILSISLFTGCSLFSYDNARDYNQVVASVKSVTITDESSEENKNNPFVTEKKDIYKYELVNMLNSSGQTMISYGYTLEQAVDYLVDQLVTRELILNEADAQIHFKNIIWGQNEENQVLQGIYNTVDSQLATIRNEILTEHGEETADTSSSDTSSTDTSTETTYPVKETEEPGLYDSWSREELIAEVVNRTKGDLTGEALTALNEKVSEYSVYKLRATLENLDLQDVEKWEPDTIRYPGLYGTDDVKSLELEAMRRFISLLKETVKDDYRMTKEQRKIFNEEIAGLEKVGNEKGLSYVYPELGETQLMQFLAGDTYRDNVKIQLLQQYITDSVDVSEEEIVDEYNALLSEQINKYGNDAEAFSTDISGGNVDPILYYPNGNYYYVKHILVPFSDAQKAQLEAYKAGAGTIYGEEAIAAEKEKLGKLVTGYEHRDGENYGKPLTIDQIYADIVSVMKAAEGSLKASDRAFDDLIYKYNTDDGIFGNELGYPVKSVFGEGETYDTTYMQEFSEAADELFRAGKEGAISGPVVTDYGVHILYLSGIIPSGGLTVGLNDYISYGEYTSVREKIEEERRTEKENQMFSVWQNQKIGYYLTVADAVETFEKAYKDLKESE